MGISIYPYHRGDRYVHIEYIQSYRFMSIRGCVLFYYINVQRGRITRNPSCVHFFRIICKIFVRNVHPSRSPYILWLGKTAAIQNDHVESIDETVDAKQRDVGWSSKGTLIFCRFPSYGDHVYPSSDAFIDNVVKQVKMSVYI